MSASLLIRPLRAEEMLFPVDLAAREGWNPGLHDGSAFHRADPQGFLGAWRGEEPVGCISAVSYGGAFGFIGFYIVAPEHRGQGYGLRLWQAAMARLAGQTIGLDGVVAQQDNYRRSGFVLAYSDIRFEAPGGTPFTPPPPVVPLTDAPFDAVFAYDRAHFPAERRAFLQAWLTLPDSRGLAWVEGGALRGYGLIRRCRQGYKIGPLFADAPEIAEGLYLALSGGVALGTPVYLDVPEVNGEGMALAERFGMTRVFGTARMYAGPAPLLPLERIFGVTSFELG